MRRTILTGLAARCLGGLCGGIGTSVQLNHILTAACPSLMGDEVRVCMERHGVHHAIELGMRLTEMHTKAMALGIAPAASSYAPAWQVGPVYAHLPKKGAE